MKEINKNNLKICWKKTKYTCKDEINIPRSNYALINYLQNTKNI